MNKALRPSSFFAPSAVEANTPGGLIPILFEKTVKRKREKAGGVPHSPVRGYPLHPLFAALPWRFGINLPPSLHSITD